MPYPDRPHIRFPFQRGADGRIQVVEQDGPQHVMSCAAVVTHCPIGARDDRPEFGWAWPEMENAPINTTSLEQALTNFGHPDGTPNISQVYDMAASVVRVRTEIQISTSQSNPQPES